MALKVSNVYQLKIDLLQVKPKIWRRILVPEDFTFWDLSVAIEDAMRTSSSIRHYFQTRDPKAGRLQCIVFRGAVCPCPYVNGHEAYIKDYLVSPKDSAIYDQPKYGNWAYNIELEKISPEIPGTEYPLCIGGERACPPIQSHDVLHFKEFLRVLDETRNDSRERRNREIKIVMGNNFNWMEYKPEDFNPNSIEFRDSKNVLKML